MAVAANGVRVISAAWDIGARVRGSSAGPAHLLATDLCEVTATPLERGEHVTAGEGARMTAIAQANARLAQAVRTSMLAGWFPLVLGGDHSCAAGTWSGAARACRRDGVLGLVWVDAHLDSHTPESSHSGAPHGMPLAALLGHGDPAWTALAGARQALDPRHVCVLGVRSHEPEEAALLARLGVRVIGMDEVRRRGFSACLGEAHGIARRARAGFGVSVDIDALDPADAPGVGSPEPGGLRLRDLAEGMTRLGADARLAALEVVEFDPSRDRDGRTGEAVRTLVGRTLAARFGREPAAA